LNKQTGHKKAPKAQKWRGHFENCAPFCGKGIKTMKGMEECADSLLFFIMFFRHFMVKNAV
jgi:hypothetical protein